MTLAQDRDSKRQRISDDPNNLTWSQDKNRLGFKLLRKMGWSEGKRLGANLDGITANATMKTPKKYLKPKKMIGD